MSVTMTCGQAGFSKSARRGRLPRWPASVRRAITFQRVVDDLTSQVGPLPRTINSRGCWQGPVGQLLGFGA
jgi:hypothetical protein